MRGLLPWLGIAMIGAAMPAMADSLELANCKANQIEVKTYNQDDTVCWVPKSTQSIPGCGAVTLTCVNGPCKVDVRGSSYGFTCSSAETHSGEKMVIEDGGIHDAGNLLEMTATIYFNYCQCDAATMRQALGH